MMENNRTRILQILGEVIVAALLSGGLTVLSAQSIGISVNAYFVYVSAAVSAAALFGLSYSRVSGWVTLLVMVLSALIAVFFGWTPVKDFKAFLEAVYEKESLLPYTDAFCLFALILLMAAFYIMAHQKVGAYLMLFVTIILLGILWFFGETSVSVHILPIILALSAMFSKTASFRFSVFRPLISLSLIAAILSVMLVPSEGIRVEALNRYAQKALAFMIRTFNIDNNNMEERRSFTIASNGWATHKELIGGNAYPSGDEVMRLSGEAGEVYLRGALRYVYNNNAWVDESNESKAGKIKRYMFSGFEKLIYKSEFDRAMDHDKKDSDKWFEKATLDVKMLRESPYWTLYTPNRVTDVKVDTDAFVYFNNVGEIFINRQMKAGDAFRIEYEKLKISDDELADAIASCRNKKDAGYASAMVLNRDLPSGIDQSVYELTYRLTQNLSSPYEKATAIASYLKANGTYTLQSDYPPENTDAVSFFVNEGLNGYCVHFASTMAVMARIAGLPARYVEGYLASIGEDGTVVVTGKEAHAWTEIYFNGFGWVTFDPTPAEADESENDNPGDDNNAGVPEDDNGHDQDEMKDEDENPDAPPAPTPTPEPTPEPTSTPEPENDHLPDWPDQASDPSPTPTPGPWTDNRNAPGDNNSDHENNDDKKENSNAFRIVFILLLAFILIVLLVLFVIIRLRQTDPVIMEKKMRNTEDKLMLWYRCMLTSLENVNVRYEAGDTPSAFSERALERRACTEEFVRFTEVVSRRRYSESCATKEEYRIAENAYRGIVHLMPAVAKIRWYIRRIVRGIGNVNQIP